MHSNNKYDCTNPNIISIVRIKVHQLVNHKYFSKYEFQDLEQELIIEVWNKRDNYDPDKSSLSTFATKIIEDKAANLIEHRSCQKNSYKLLIHSLYEPVLRNDEESSLLAEIIPSNANFYE